MAEQRFLGPNAGYVLELYERFTRDPASVEQGWRDFFASASPGDLQALEAAGAPSAAAPTAGGAAPANMEQMFAARELGRAIRARGHTAAKLDPLGFDAPADPVLDPARYDLTDAQLAQLPASAVHAHDPRSATALDEIQRLRRVYTGPVGYEWLHLPNPDERDWLRQAIESGTYAGPLSAERQCALLDRLSQVEGFEQFLHRAFNGQKRFGIEGTDMMVPMLDELTAQAAGAGARDLVIGMAHRGRLSVLTQVLGKPAEAILAGFKAAPKENAAEPPDEPSGDVKYHMGWTDEGQKNGHGVRVRLAPNPSHLEFVDPVVVGMARAAQDDTSAAGPPGLDAARALAVLIHGDAAFPGQGVVPETFNMQGLAGYTVGGTIHIIANNQVGFTTDPEQGRSTRYASDLAKGFDVPIVHVNADEPEACLAVARLAHAYRRRWGKDFVIDLVGYRRYGHNEGDVPEFTQPVMYARVAGHPTVRKLLADRLVRDGVLSAEEAEAPLQRVAEELRQKLDNAAPAPHAEAGHASNGKPTRDTALPREILLELNAALLARPEGFTPHPKVEAALRKRADAVNGNAGIDWGHAETLAFASLVAEGTPVRLTGQDVERGTFSHRHAVLRDVNDGRRLNVFHHLPQAKASLEIHNSPLSETAVLGFEYGYSVGDPQALVLWEAQYGDFVNGAQVIIDQFLTGSYQKWRQRSGLVLLLPHGYEGGGPEHSSARLERFLQLCAENNLRVANCTTSANYFHLLRRQAALLHTDPRPLVVMSPKSLLRHPMAASSIDQLAEGRFQPVVADAAAAERAQGVTRLLLCSGKVYVDLVGDSDEKRAERAAVPGVERVAIGRIEELYPFPLEELRALAATYPNLQEIVWVQEEPHNMGAWSYVAPQLVDGLKIPLRYVGRPDRASPAEGTMQRHQAWQNKIVFDALGGAPQAGPPARGGEKLIGKRK